jgi:SRSO17 transposase
MDAKQIKQLEPMLNKYLRRFDDCFGRIEPVERLKAYVAGQLSDLQRKSIEPMADAAGLPPRNLQQFLSLHKWDEMRMRDTVEQIVANEHQHPCSIGVLDETGHSKKGDKTPGVQRQWCGNTGKTDNCVVTVHLNFWMGNCSCRRAGRKIKTGARPQAYQKI